MNEGERRTHMWRGIVRRAFACDDHVETSKWLNCFRQSVWSYLDNPIPPCLSESSGTWKGRFGHQTLLTCEFTITRERSQFDLLRPEWHAQFGIDRTVFAPACGAREEAGNVTDDDVSVVLRGMIEHPRVHLHVFDDPEYHEVRLGTGLEDALLFLFQVRFQLNLDPDRREAEMVRLRGIFTPEWFREDRDLVSPAHLFGLKAQ